MKNNLNRKIPSSYQSGRKDGAKVGQAFMDIFTKLGENAQLAHTRPTMEAAQRAVQQTLTIARTDHRQFLVYRFGHNPQQGFACNSLDELPDCIQKLYAQIDAEEEVAKAMAEKKKETNNGLH